MCQAFLLIYIWLVFNHRNKKINGTKEDERTHKQSADTPQPNLSEPKSSKPDTGFGGRGIAKAFKDAGIGINSKLGVKKTAISSGSLSRDVSDDGDSLLKRQPIIAEKCMQFFLSVFFCLLTGATSVCQYFKNVFVGWIYSMLEIGDF